jgi:hypothetical protein
LLRERAKDELTIVERIPNYGGSIAALVGWIHRETATHVVVVEIHRAFASLVWV